MENCRSAGLRSGWHLPSHLPDGELLMIELFVRSCLSSHLPDGELQNSRRLEGCVLSSHLPDGEPLFVRPSRYA